MPAVKKELTEPVLWAGASSFFTVLSMIIMVVTVSPVMAVTLGAFTALTAGMWTGVYNHAKQAKITGAKMADELRERFAKLSTALWELSEKILITLMFPKLPTSSMRTQRRRHLWETILLDRKSAWRKWLSKTINDTSSWL